MDSFLSLGQPIIVARLSPVEINPDQDDHVERLLCEFLECLR